MNWTYVLAEAQGWVADICECGHPDTTHIGGGGACGENDCYGSGIGRLFCEKFHRVKLKVTRA